MVIGSGLQKICPGWEEGREGIRSKQDKGRQGISPRGDPPIRTRGGGSGPSPAIPPLATAPTGRERGIVRIASPHVRKVVWMGGNKLAHGSTHVERRSRTKRMRNKERSMVRRMRTMPYDRTTIRGTDGRRTTTKERRRNKRTRSAIPPCHPRPRMNGSIRVVVVDRKRKTHATTGPGRDTNTECPWSCHHQDK